MLVGRDVETAVVAAALRTPGQVLTVLGDAGVGKSGLLDAAATAVRGDVLVLTGRCLPLSVDLPLLPVLDVLRTLHAADGGATFTAALARCPDFVGSELARLMPELGEAAPGEAQRQQQYEAVRRVLAEAGPAAVVIDDLHWCDSASLDLLEYLLARPDAPPVVLAVRPIAELNQRIRQWLARILRLPSARRLDLEALGADDVGRMLTALGWSGTADAAALIAERSGGVPYYVEQLAAVDPGSELPRTLQTLLLDRAAGLSESARDLLQVLAAAGRPVTDDELHSACGDRVGESLRELQARGLAAAAGSAVGSAAAGPARRAPVHALLAEAVCAELTAEELRRLHLRLADAFAVQPQVDADDVARHLARAGDPVREAEFRLRAADQARRRAAPREAYGHLARVIAIDPSADVSVYLDAYVLARHAGETAAAAELAERMLARFEASAPDAVRMRLWHAVGHHRVIRDPAGLEALARAVEVGRSLPRTPDYGYALYDLVRHLRGRGDTTAARALGPELAEVAAECGDADLVALVDAEQACHAFLAGADDAAAAALTRARAGSARAIGQGLATAGVITYLLLMTGRLAETVTYGQQVIAEREASGLSAASVTGSLRADVAIALLEQGRADEAALVLGQASVGPPTPEAAASAETRTAVDVAQGRIDDAVRYWDQTPPLLAYPVLLTEAAPLLLTALLAAGRPADAMAHGLRALEVVLRCDESRFAGATLALVRRAMGDLVESGTPPAQVRRRSDALDAAVEAAPVDPFAARSFPVAGAAAGLTDRAERTRVHGQADPEQWRAAAQAWRALGRPWRSAYCGWRGAQAALAARGSRPDGVEMLRRAWVEADGHVPLRAAVVELARVARIELPDAVTAAPVAKDMFTDREAAVLELLADGMTNAQIGRTLYISPKTVSVHVTNILRKLEVHTRVEAATKAQRAGLLAKDLVGAAVDDRPMTGPGRGRTLQG